MSSVRYGQAATFDELSEIISNAASELNSLAPKLWSQKTSSCCA